jgi:hypothetical protein
MEGWGILAPAVGAAHRLVEVGLVEVESESAGDRSVEIRSSPGMGAGEGAIVPSASPT